MLCRYWQKDCPLNPTDHPNAFPRQALPVLSWDPNEFWNDSAMTSGVGPRPGLYGAMKMFGPPMGTLERLTVSQFSFL
jgi:hypothetical protein